MFNLKKGLYLFFCLGITLSFISCGKKEYTTSKLLAISLFHAEKGEWKKANEFSTRALKKDSENLDALIMNAVTLEYILKVDDAIDNALLAVKISPDNYFCQYNLGRLLYKKELYSDSLAPLNKAEQIESTNEIKLLLSDVYIKLSENKKAIRLLHILSKTEEYIDNPAIFNELGVLWTKEGNKKKGVAFLKKAFSLNNENQTIALNLGILCDKYFESPRFAKIYYMKYLKIIKNNPELAQKYKEIQSKVKDINLKSR